MSKRDREEEEKYIQKIIKRKGTRNRTLNREPPQKEPKAKRVLDSDLPSFGCRSLNLKLNL